jgi:hypothetical protein
MHLSQNNEHDYVNDDLRSFSLPDETRKVATYINKIK